MEFSTWSLNQKSMESCTYLVVIRNMSRQGRSESRTKESTSRVRRREPNTRRRRSRISLKPLRITTSRMPMRSTKLTLNMKTNNASPDWNWSSCMVVRARTTTKATAAKSISRWRRLRSRWRCSAGEIEGSGGPAGGISCGNLGCIIAPAGFCPPQIAGKPGERRLDSCPPREGGEPAPLDVVNGPGYVYGASGGGK